jgi:hypothetical protein
MGAGAGGSARGLFVGGIGAGAGGDISGVLLAGIGAGAGGIVKALAISGVAAGAGGNFVGIAISGVASGAGGDMTGLSLSGVAAGAGGTLKGVVIAGIAVGAPHLEGGFAALAVGAKEARAVVLAPAYFKIERGGTFRGGSASAFNEIRGSMTGLTIGLVNYAWSVNGVQIGVINVIADQKSHPFLPVFNWGSR